MIEVTKQAKAEFAAARKAMKAVGVSGLLAAPLSNPKVAKNGKLGVLTAPMHLAPAKLSGFEVCPMASAGCRAACLHTAGNPAYMKGKARARNARTQAYFNHRDAFMKLLAAEIVRHVNRAAKLQMEPAIRLNATSDIPWERVPVTVDGTTYPNLMTAFPKVKFYDYTKRYNRKNLPANYHLTFSLAEDNDAYAAQAFQNGLNVAVVFATGRNKPLPKSFALMGVNIPVIDGDEHDYRPADEINSIVGLRAKGDAIGDDSGFVRECA